MERGFEETLNRVKRVEPTTPKLLDGKREARVIALRLGEPPKGYANWTLRLLARKVVELAIVETVSDETVHRTLKKPHDQPRDRALGILGRCNGASRSRRRVRRLQGGRAGSR